MRAALLRQSAFTGITPRKEFRAKDSNGPLSGVPSPGLLLVSLGAGGPSALVSVCSYC
jgi:hypothetical protein